MTLQDDRDTKFGIMRLELRITCVDGKTEEIVLVSLKEKVCNFWV